ncbi:MmcQ/YjbR family DNA-binding protein [Citricoccus nitrophenolicus]|uniref:MmcQ/YjbR family DNA-binding protein n=1 Tax=Citricoccus nitrophenolicus TaxID=863575 RepID=A0ABV0IDU5_9MICC|nr:MmcQ/YjbR family DNA-binding protein [Citricoccus sp. I39-566]WMY77196.1 MmcQ/YjbR family DNA-binding protein [Citricoccus sp. I39-566]
MDRVDLHRVCSEAALQFPAVTVEQPFGPDSDVYKVKGRMFMFLAELDGEAIVNLKADPEDSGALRQAYPEITPGYHMNKRHWITVTGGKNLTAALLRELVIDSYRLVVEKLPRHRRPVDPETFGSA